MPNIIAFPTERKAEEMNELHCVALTSMVAKCFESQVLNDPLPELEDKTDALQAAYRSVRSESRLAAGRALRTRIASAPVIEQFPGSVSREARRPAYPQQD